MTNEWTIRGKRLVGGTEQTVDIVVVKELELHDEWMGECFLTISVKSAEPIEFSVGDYIDYRNERYTIEYDPTVLKKARRSTYGEGFTYDNIKFVNEAQAKVVRCDFTDIVLSDNKQHYTSLPTFPFYCESVDDLLDRIQANLDELYGANVFTIIGMNTARNRQRGGDYINEYRKWIDPTWDGVTDVTAPYGSIGVPITADNIGCWDALSKVHTDFNLNFIMRGYTIVVGTAGMFTASKFKYGKGNGLYEIEKIGDSEQQIVTRLRAYGAETNLPLNYYANKNKQPIFVGKRAKEKSEIVGRDWFYGISTEILWNNVKAAFNITNESSSYLCGIEYNGTTAQAWVVTRTNGVDSGAQYLYLSLITDNDQDLAFYNALADDSAKTINITSNIKKEKWPASMFLTSAEFPQSLVMNRLMLPGFPDESLYAWATNPQKGGWTVVDANKGTASKNGLTLAFSKEIYRPYIDSPNVDVYGIRPGSIYFDGNGDTEDIHPSITGSGYDQIVSATQVDDQGVYNEKDPDPITITIPGMGGFKLDEAWKENESSIDITDGMCGGRSFQIEKPKLVNGNWECKCKRAKDDSLHLWFPYCDFQINANGRRDHFVLTGIDLPDEYVELASERLFDAAIEALRKNDSPRFTYQPRIDEIWMQREDDTAPEGQSIHDTLKAGDIFQFEDEDMGIDAAIIIDVLTIKENGNNGLATYEVTLRDEKQVSTIQKIQNKIDSLATGGNGVGSSSGGGSSATAAQIESLVPSAGADYFLSKNTADEAKGIITFLKGIKIGVEKLFGWNADGDIAANNVTIEGNISAGGRMDVGGNASIGGDLHVSGIFDAIEAKINSLQSHNYSGSNLGDTGWKLTNNDGSGNSLLEVDKLLVRMKATFMELEIRKETFSGGNNHYSPAGSVIFKVDYLTEDDQLLGYRNQKVPWLLRGIAFLFGNKSYTRQRHIRYAFTLDQLTPAERAQVAKFRCYLISDDGTTATRNWWQVGDQPRCQSFNKALSRENKRTNPYDTTTPGTTDPATPLSSDFWWRLITECGSKVMDDGKIYDFIDMPYEHYADYEDEYRRHPENFCAAGSGIPQEGDTIVCMGNRTDPARMNLISIISVATDYSDAPAIKAWRGIHTFSFDGCEVFGFSYSKVRVQSRSFEWITDDGSTLPNILERGAYEAGVRYHWYDRVSHHGSMWLCQIADTKIWVDAAGDPIATPPTADIVTGDGVYVYDQANNKRDRYYSLAVSNGTTYGYYVQNWTYDEPTDTNNNWLKQVSKGTEITDSVIRYAASLSGITPPNVETSWKETIEATGIIAGQYLWTRTTTYYSDGRTPTVEYSVARWGIDGDGIAEIDSFYWATTEVVAMTKQWDEAHLLPWDATASQETKKSMWAPTYSDLETVWGGAGNMQGMYVWEKTVIKYDMANNPDGTPVTKPDAISYQCNRIGNDGLIGEEEYYFLAESDDFTTVFGNPSQAASYVYAKTGIRWYTEDTPRTTDLPAAENYRLSSTTPNICTSAAQQVTTATPIWSPTMPVYAGDAKKYLWNFEQRVDGTGTQYATKPICLGNHARGITGILELYALSSSKTPISAERPIPTDINSKNTWGVIPTSGFSDPNVWGDERYDRGPTEALPYQWNWTRTLYSDGGYEDHYHVSASRGTKGEDGAGKEYVYFQPQTHNADGTPRTYTIPDVNSTHGQCSPGYDAQGNPKPADGSETYDNTLDDWVPQYWTDNPRGIDFTHQVEYRAERKSTYVAGAGGFTGSHTWGAFSTPQVWSKWGQNGMDGDGVEYVYIRTNSNVAPTIVNSPDSRTDSHGRTYLDDEYLPLASGGTLTTATECTDNPLGTDADHKFEWMAKRVMTAPNPETGERTWKKYSGSMALHHNFAKSITKDSEDYRYKVTDDGTTTPTGTWYNTRAAAEAAYPWTADRWMWVEITINWSDGSRTTLYTNERNPNDGKAGQDIIVDGATVMKYAVSNTNTTQPTTWYDYADIVSQIVPGKWLWAKATTNYKKSSDGTSAGSSTNYSVSYIGENGIGISSTNIYYKASASTPSTPSGAPSGSGWVDDGNTLITTANASNHLYESTCTTYTNGTYSWTSPIDDGLISDMAATSEEFALADSGTTAPTTGWSSSVTPTVGKWVWSRTKLTFKSGNPSYVNTQCVGYCGTNGVGLSEITEWYKASSSSSGVQAPPVGQETAYGWSLDPNTAMTSWNQTNRYLWNYERIKYTNNTYDPTDPSVIAIWTKDGDAGRGIDSIVNYYAINNDPLNPPPSSQTGAQGWDDNPIAPNSDYPYLWNYEVINWTTGTPSSTTTTPQVIGHYGNDGDDSVTYEIVLTEAWAKRDNSINRVVTGRLSGRSYRIQGGTWTPVSGETIEYGYQSGDHGNTTTNSSGYFTSGNYFEDQWSGSYVNESTCIYATLKIDGVAVCTKYVTIVFDGDDGQPGQPGQPGAAGKTGRMFYSLGEWSPFTTYTRTDDFVPMVHYSNGNDWNANLDMYGNYYYLKVDSSTGYTPSSSSDHWALCNDFTVVITQALFAAFAKLGGFIVSGDYFFSQYGTLYSRSSSLAIDSSNKEKYFKSSGSYIQTTSSYLSGYQKAYTYLDSSDPLVETKPGSYELKFKPALCINAVTGKMHMAGGNVIIDESGNVIVKNAEVEGTIKAQLFYAATKKITSNYPINLETEPYYTYFKEPTYNTSYVVTLPDPSSYDGVELRFFSPVVGSSGNVMRVYYSEGINLCLDTGVSSVLYVALKPFKMGTLKAIDGKWWTIDDGFVQGGS